MSWAELTPPQRAALLRPLIEIDGLTYRQAADRLGTTKNSIVGVASRLKLKLKAAHPPHGTSAPRGPRKARVSSTVLKVRQSRASHSNRLPVPGYPDGEVADPTPIEGDIWLPLPGTTPIALENHHDSQCRWIVGARLYCGAPVGL